MMTINQLDLNQKTTTGMVCPTLPELPFDPIERSLKVESAVMVGDARQYYRFRHTQFYGGIITCDGNGCNLLCAQCWNYERNAELPKTKFYNPREVAKKIIDLCVKNDQWYVRISGCEPILGERSARHFKAIMDACDEIAIDQYEEVCNFILETNGLMLGYMPELVEVLTGNYMTVRISFKGHNEKTFQAVTGAKAEYWQYPFTALKKCQEIGIQVIPACMPAFSEKAKLEELIGMKITDTEKLRAYGKGYQRMKERGVDKYRL